MKPDLTRSFNMDCMDFMKDVPDKFYELAVVDPPYGIGEDGKSNSSRGTKKAPATKYSYKNWDKSAPSKEYFEELLRVSKNQIIWGANHFISKIPYDSSCWLVWDKDTAGDFADCELAWTSFKTAVRKFYYCWSGYNQGIMGRSSGPNIEKRIHPTQKPIKLYEWLLMNYAKEGDKILDTHGGSQSSRIACYNLGYALDIIELDKEYFDQGNKRFETHKQQLTLF
jgi:site-specific DNA-methyltransferase (adenine-specific)